MLSLPKFSKSLYFYIAQTGNRNNTELNDLRTINICLRKSEVLKKKLFFTVLENFVEHGIHCLPCSYSYDVIDTSSWQL